MKLESHLQIAKTLARQAGDELLKKFYDSSTLEFRDKGAGDIVSAADEEADAIICEGLRSHFPDCRIYSEESGLSGSDESGIWVVDPLDGTNNYAVGIPQWSVSIGFLREGRAALGVVLNPVTGLLVSATRGGGVCVNGVGIVSRDGPRAPGRIVAALDVPYGGDALALATMRVLGARAKRILTNWSPALDYVALATGKIDAIICLGAEVEDKIAGLTIISEAGCRVAGLTGGPGEELLCEKIPESGKLPAFVAARDSELVFQLRELLRPLAGARAARSQD